MGDPNMELVCKKIAELEVLMNDMELPYRFIKNWVKLKEKLRSEGYPLDEFINKVDKEADNP